MFPLPAIAVPREKEEGTGCLLRSPVLPGLDAIRSYSQEQPWRTWMPALLCPELGCQHNAIRRRPKIKTNGCKISHLTMVSHFKTM